MSANTHENRVSGLPVPEPRSTDWAYIRTYYQLADASAEPFAEVNIRATDLETILRRLVKAESRD